MKQIKSLNYILLSIFLFSILSFNVYAQECAGCPSSNDSGECASKELHKNPNNTDEFQLESDDEFNEIGEDEFSNASDNEFSSDDDEFSSEDDEFSSELNDGETETSKTSIFVTPLAKKTYWLLGITILAGFFVRKKQLRSFRAVFLLGGMVWLGFYSGACPCMISSFQNFLLMFIGEAPVSWDKLFWFIGLIPITYIFGRVWCGWLCHLGALQEFLYLPTKYAIWQSAKAQKILKYVRYFMLLVLLVQLVITRSNLFIHIDPFKVAYNLYSPNLTGYILLGILLVLSIFSYRPFCKGICPIGTILGWIERIPGASILGVNNSCNGCSVCNKTCNIGGINKEDGALIIDNEECIMCGECISNCKKDGINFERNTKKRFKVKFYERKSPKKNDIG